MKRVFSGLAAMVVFLGVDGRAEADYAYSAFFVPGSLNTEAWGINDSGQIVGRYTTAGMGHGFLLSGGTYTSIDVSGPYSTDANGINNGGLVVGTYFNPSTNPSTHGFLRSGGSYTPLNGAGRGINNQGQIVGTSGLNGFLLSGGNYTIIRAPGSDYTETDWINDAGQIVGNYSNAAGGHAFVLIGGTYTLLNVPGSFVTTAFGINNAGQIVGYYLDGAGTQHGFLATLTTVPEPSTLFLVGIGTLGASGFAWRRRSLAAA
jgi:hypothetical protein